MKIEIPQALRDTGGEYPVLAEGPFVIEHNGVRCLGSYLKQATADEYSVEDETRGYPLDNRFSVRVEGDMVVFTSPELQSTFKIRPLEITDAVWITPDQSPANLAELDEIAADMLWGDTQNELTGLVAAATPAPDPRPHTFITLDDTDSVLELCRSDVDGIYVRSNGQWFMIDANADEEDIPNVWNREWVDVKDDSVATFDAADQAEQPLNRGDFEEFIIA